MEPSLARAIIMSARAAVLELASASAETDTTTVTEWEWELGSEWASVSVGMVTAMDRVWGSLPELEWVLGSAGMGTATALV